MADVQLSTKGPTIKTAYEGEDNTNAFTDAAKEKVEDAVISDITGIDGAVAIPNIVAISRDNYDALEVVDATVGYLILDE